MKEWKKEWIGMPEFKMKDLSSHKSVIVHFRNEEDYKEFEKLMKQRIVKKNSRITIWYPEMKTRYRANLRYEDEP